MFGHFRNLLEGIVAIRANGHSELPILTESEKHQLLVRGTTLRELFFGQVYP
jgi:hypothetical protein